MPRLPFPDKTLIHVPHYCNALLTFSPSFNTKDGHGSAERDRFFCFRNEVVVISFISLRIGAASHEASLASVIVKVTAILSV